MFVATVEQKSPSAATAVQLCARSHIAAAGRAGGGERYPPAQLRCHATQLATNVTAQDAKFNKNINASALEPNPGTNETSHRYTKSLTLIRWQPNSQNNAFSQRLPDLLVP